MNDVIEFDKTKSIKQSNRLVVARYRLTKYEQRLMMAICSQLDKNAESFTKVKLRAGDVADFCNFKGKDKYNQVHSTILKLMSRTLQIQKENGKWYVTHWLQSADYLDGGYIEYCIDEKLRPELLQLKAAYLMTPAAPLMEFRRDYSARLYFILKKMLKIKDFDYDLDFFRDRFQLGKTYQQISNLKDRVLEPAITEINEKSDIQVKHEYIKEGRSYKKIHFNVSLKHPEKPLISKHPVKRVKLTDEQQAIYDRLTNKTWELTDDVARKMIKKYKLERIDNALKYAYKNRKGKHSMGGWLIDCIEKDYAGNKAKTDKENEARAQAKKADKKQAKEFFNGENTIKGDYSAPVIIKDGKVISQ